MKYGWQLSYPDINTKNEVVTPMSVPAIHVDHVWKKFRKGEFHDSLREVIPAIAKRLIGRGPKRENLEDREFWALKDLSFEVQQGESLGIIGPNGAGKSTLLKLLSQILKPNRGAYHVNGRISALIEVGAGFHGDLTGRENIYLNGSILGMTRKVIQTKEEQIIDFSGVEDFIETPIKRYSSGMKARLGFAIAAHMEPDVLLVDEVLSVGDVRFRQKCLRHMRNLISSNVTVIFISHMLEQVRSLCPTTLVLDHGESIYYGPTDGAIKAYIDALGSDSSDDEGVSNSQAELRNMRFFDLQGKEILDWKASEPAVTQCDLVIHKPIDPATVQINISTLGGTYIGTTDSQKQGATLPTQPGTYTLRLTIDPMVLADGEYSIRFNIIDIETKRFIWSIRQPRVVSIAGGGAAGAILRLNAQWEISNQSSVGSVAAKA